MLIDITGQRFGRLVVVGRVENNHKGLPQWLARCDCGVDKIVLSGNLRAGRQRSCGCLNAEVRRQLGKPRAGGHGLYKSGAYRSWLKMKDRCLNTNHIHYSSYGGRGIKICEEWMDFKRFFADMGHRPEGKSLDRIDSNGNYEFQNCKWSTPKEQANNTRRKKAA